MNIEANFSAPAEREIHPVVALPRSGIPGVVIAFLAAALAILLFTVLDGQRRRAAQPEEKSEIGDAAILAAPPALFVPPQPAPQPQIIAIPQAQSQATPVNPKPVAPPPAPVMAASAPPVQNLTPAPQSVPSVSYGAPFATALPSETQGESLSEPALVIDAGALVRPAPDSAAGQSVAGESSGAPSAGTWTVSKGSSAGPLTGTRLANRTTLMPTGTIIPAVLETPIDTSRPGLVRAVVSQDARGFDGRRVLVPRGSRLIGECQGQVKSGQSRVLVNWTRVILPDGIAIALDSPAADPLGGSGVPGKVNSFFLARFFNSALQSALYVGESILGRRAGTTVVVGMPNGTVTNLATQGFSSGPQPKIRVNSGALINVFVAHDIDFSSASARR